MYSFSYIYMNYNYKVLLTTAVKPYYVYCTVEYALVVYLVAVATLSRGFLRSYLL